jgi:NADP-dependent aldehyde dehydrogenase
MQHGGPWPSTTSSASTSVGAAALERWLRPVTFQSVPDGLLPLALQESNPLSIPRRVDGVLRHDG